MLSKNQFALLCALVSAVSNFSAFAQESRPVEEIVVTAEFVDSNLLELPNSVTVIDSDAINQRSAQNLEDLFAFAPNINFATGASRGRFIQIRGIGERSEFQEPINNSVGVIVDGVDFTGISAGVSTLDIQQVEILRGPQGTLFGANALAGLINVVSNKPSSEPYAKVTVGVEQYDGREASAVISGPTSDKSGYRLAVKHYESDGFTRAVFLGRDDTNNIHETTAKTSYTAQVNDALKLDFSLFYADIDNGFDAFSLSNVPGDHSRATDTDEPGVDRQETYAPAFKLSYDINESLKFEGTLSAAFSDLEYSFDEDWSNLFLCDAPGVSCPFGDFSSFDQYERDNENQTLDFRLLYSPLESVSAVFGAYYRDQSVDLERVRIGDPLFQSELDTTNTALYGQVKFDINQRLSLTNGLRVERREVDYRDITGASSSPNETLWGGRIALEYLADDGTFIYGLVSRGYKAGGFNLEGSLSEANREFDTETLVNYEVGLKKSFLNDSLTLQASIFFQDRKDIQVSQSIVSSLATGEIDGVCPCDFTDFTGNSAGGTNEGVEVEVDWVVNNILTFSAALGYLHTEFEDFESFSHINADRDTGVAFDLDGREQAQAPSYTAFLGANLNITNHISLNLSSEAKDDFLFSDSHEGRSDSYVQHNFELSYSVENWSIAFYGKNITDEVIETRGFGIFGNDPRDGFTLNEYTQLGAPRVLGIKASFEF